MIRYVSTSALILCLLSISAAANPSKASVKVATLPPAKELAEPIRALLNDTGLQVSESDKPICDIWLRRELPLKAGTNVQKGLTYREMPESTLVGAIRLHQDWSSFRKQKIKPGVYTLRLAFQPMDGDHMGTAPYNEFLLLSPTAADQKPANLEAKAMFQQSAKCLPGNSHPIVLLLFPNPNPEDTPKLVDKGNHIWVLNSRQSTQSKGTLGLGLTLFGASESE